MSPFNVILCPVDRSEPSDKAVAVARDLALLSGGTVHLLHVREREEMWGKFSGTFELETGDEVQSLLDKELQALRGAEIKVTTHVVRGRSGDVYRAIAELADQIGADVIVMGSRGLSPFEAAVLGSTTYHVVHTVKRPVVVVP